MYKRGTIVLTPFPFTDLSGQKVRPAVIISKSLRSLDVVVLFITSKQKKSDHSTVLIHEPKTTGLKVPSAVVCDKIATLDRRVILGEMGVVPSAILKQIDSELISVLGL
jgi:mRNA interferase MazF